MNILTSLPRSATREREHAQINTALSTLAAEYPHCTPGDLYDALIKAGHRLDDARALINAATLAGMPVGEWLADRGRDENRR
jgi:hypothetical protein